LRNPFFFAFRLVFSKEIGSFSRFASLLSIGGLSIGVTALILTVSIIQGFQDVISIKLSSFEGTGRIKHILSKPINLNSKEFARFSSKIDSKTITPYFRDIALIRKGRIADGIIIEGSSLIPTFIKSDSLNLLLNNEIIIGKILAKNLKVKKGDKVFVQSLNIKNKSIIKPLSIKDVFYSGLQEFDKTMTYTNLSTAQEIFEMNQNQISGLIFKNKIEQELIQNITYPLIYEDWKSRHSLLFEWIKLQRWPAYIMFGLITLVGLVNLVASLNMIIQEKKAQIAILFSQGININDLKFIFMLQGGIIGLFGAVIGGFFSVFLIILEKKINIFKIPSDVYFMDRVPLSFDMATFLSIVIIIFFISLLFSLIPLKYIKKINVAKTLKYE
jgi:lipoprotein-releasing system permease protein